MGAVVVKRPNAGIGPDDVRLPWRVAQPPPGGLQEIGGLPGIDRGVGRIAVERDVGRADQGEVALVRDDEEHPAVVVLEQIGVIAVIEPGCDDVAALDEAQPRAAFEPGKALDAGGPGTGGVDEDAGLDLAPVAQPEMPCGGLPPRRDEGGAGGDLRAVQRGVAGDGDGQPRIVDDAIGIDESLAGAAIERGAARVAVEPDRLGAGQGAGAAEMVVEKEAGAHHPARPQPRRMRQHKAHRPHQAGRRAQQHRALGKRLAHELEIVPLEIAQPAMDHLARRGGGPAGEVALLAQKHLEPAPCGVADDPATVDAAANDGEVVAADHDKRRSANSTNPAPASASVTYAGGVAMRGRYVWTLATPTALGK